MERVKSIRLLVASLQILILLLTTYFRIEAYEAETKVVPVFAEIAWGSSPDQVASIINQKFALSLQSSSSSDFDAHVRASNGYPFSFYSIYKVDNIHFLGNKWKAFFLFDDAPGLILVELYMHFDKPDDEIHLKMWDNFVSEYQSKYGDGLSEYYLLKNDPNNDYLEYYFGLFGGDKNRDLVRKMIQNTPSWHCRAYDINGNIIASVVVDYTRQIYDVMNDEQIQISYVSQKYFEWEAKKRQLDERDM